MDRKTAMSKLISWIILDTCLDNPTRREFLWLVYNHQKKCKEAEEQVDYVLSLIAETSEEDWELFIKGWQEVSSLEVRDEALWDLEYSIQELMSDLYEEEFTNANWIEEG